MTAARGITVDITTPDGVADAYLAHPGGDGKHPAVLFYMDAFGLRPHLHRMADRLAAEGYTVLVPNLFYRAGRTPVLELPEFIDPGERPEIFQTIGPIMRQLTPELAMRDAGAHLEWLADSPLTTGEPVGITGYCMGAVMALRTAGNFPERVAAVGGFHGGNLATEEPDSPHLVADKITAEVYFGHADQDHALPPEQIERLDRALTKAGVRFRAEVYEGAAHGYTQADTAAYDEAGTERHWAALLDLFQRNLR